MMPTDQRLARAIQKASEQRAHVLSLPGRPGFFQVRSATDASERYTVAVHGADIACSCLAAACVNTRACGQRIRERDAHMNERWSLTEAGRAALAAVEASEVA